MKITKEFISRLIRESVMEILAEEGQPEPYDAASDSFAASPRDRTEPSLSSQKPTPKPIEEDPMYVEYVSQRKGEVPFRMGDDNKYEYVNAKYPSGKIDIGVYTFGQDMVFSYNTFRNMYNIK